MCEEGFWRPFGRSIFYSILMMLLVSCGKQKDGVAHSKNAQQKENAATRAQLKAAKFCDVPVPVGYHFLDIMHGDQLDFPSDEIQKSEAQPSDFFCYQGNMPIERVIDYYLKTMERLGWDIKNFSNTTEGMIVCNKLHKDCVVSIRDIKTKKGDLNNIFLFIHDKRASVLEGEKDINAKEVVNITLLDDQNYLV